MAKMNWARVRGQRMVHERGAEAINTTDRTISSTGRRAKRPERPLRNPQASFGQLVKDRTKKEPSIRKILELIKRNEASKSVRKAKDD